MSTGISGSKTVFNCATTFGCSSAVTAGSNSPISGFSDPVGSGGGAVSASVFHASGALNGDGSWCQPLRSAAGVGAAGSGVAGADGAVTAAASSSFFEPVKNEKRPMSSTQQFAHAAEGRDERVDVLCGVVHRERGARGRRNAEAIHDGLRAVMAGPNRDAFAIDNRADVVRVRAVEDE